MTQETASYRNIIKSTSILGGVQVFQILITVIKGKFIAILLGSAGMGISGLLSSTITMISGFSGLGLNYSAVREISQSNEAGDIKKLSKTITVFRRWLWFSSLLGATIIIVFSKQFSFLAFKNIEYRWAFICLSVIIVLITLNNGNIVLLQGTRRIKDMAKASLLGALSGLFTSLPIYYFWGIKGIVPALIIGAFSTFLTGFYFAKKIKHEKVKITMAETLTEGSEMAKLGVAMMIAALLGSIVTFTINAFISHQGSISDVGLYQAGTSITNQYIGLVFTAMSLDYFPRLAAISSDRLKVNAMVNQQAEITILIAVPILAIMMLTAPLLIRILLSKEFFVITGFIRWVAFSMIFKAASYALGYISFAKGDKKTFLILEGIFGNIFSLMLNIIGYWLGGLTGMAISFIINYIVYFIVIIIVTRKLYGFVLHKDFIRLFIISTSLAFIIFISLITYSNIYSYLFASLVFCISFYYSYIELDKRIGIRAILISAGFKLRKMFIR